MAKHIDDLSIIKHGPEVLNISFQVRKKTYKPNKSTEKQQVFCISWSRNQLSVNTKTVCFGKILLAQAERAY